MKFCCSVCEYMTDIKANYNKHLLSQKHKFKVENSHAKCSDTKSISCTLESKSEVSLGKSKVSPGKSKVSPEIIPEVSPEVICAEIINPFECKYCGQQYKHKQSVTKHIKYSCTKNKTEDLTELVRLLNLQLEQQKNEFETKLQSQTKQIEKLMDKLEINNYTNSNNTTINVTNNINLLNYKDTDTSHLTNNDYKKCLEQASRCVLKLIEKVHFMVNYVI